MWFRQEKRTAARVNGALKDGRIKNKQATLKNVSRGPVFCYFHLPLFPICDVSQTRAKTRTLAAAAAAFYLIRLRDHGFHFVCSR